MEFKLSSFELNVCNSATVFPIEMTDGEKALHRGSVRSSHFIDTGSNRDTANKFFLVPAYLLLVCEQLFRSIPSITKHSILRIWLVADSLLVILNRAGDWNSTLFLLLSKKPLQCWIRKTRELLNWLLNLLRKTMTWLTHQRNLNREGWITTQEHTHVQNNGTHMNTLTSWDTCRLKHTDSNIYTFTYFGAFQL